MRLEQQRPPDYEQWNNNSSTSFQQLNELLVQRRAKCKGRDSQIVCSIRGHEEVFCRCLVVTPLRF
jgi:asparagine synthetase A